MKIRSLWRHRDDLQPLFSHLKGPSGKGLKFVLGVSQFKTPFKHQSRSSFFYRWGNRAREGSGFAKATQRVSGGDKAGI